MPRFQWLQRLEGGVAPEPEIEFILFPGEATLAKVRERRR